MLSHSMIGFRVIVHTNVLIAKVSYQGNSRGLIRKTGFLTGSMGGPILESPVGAAKQKKTGARFVAIVGAKMEWSVPVGRSLTVDIRTVG